MAERHPDKAPDTKLGRLAEEMVEHFERLDHKPVRLLVMLDDPEEKRSMIGMSGYDEDTDAMVALFMHLKAIFEANGKQLLLAPLNQG